VNDPQNAPLMFVTVTSPVMIDTFGREFRVGQDQDGETVIIDLDNPY
jgi:hypothetical protein